MLGLLATPSMVGASGCQLFLVSSGTPGTKLEAVDIPVEADFKRLGLERMNLVQTPRSHRVMLRYNTIDAWTHMPETGWTSLAGGFQA